MSSINENLLQYKGQPLVRCGNKIYYGDAGKEYILVLTILDSQKNQSGIELPCRVLVQIQSTDPALALKKEKIVKETEKKSLYDALEIGSIWLYRELKA